MSRFRVPLLTLVVCALAAGLVAWDVVRSAEASIRGHRKEMEDYFAQADDVRRTRPPLLDPPSPGNAWDTYRSTLPEFYETPALAPFILSNTHKIDHPSATFGTFLPTLDRLRAAFRQTAVPPPDPGEVGSMAINVTQLLSRLAEALSSNGHDREAMDLWMIVIGLTQDLQRVIEQDLAASLSQQIEDGVTFGLRALEAHSLGAEDLESLCATLDRLDRTRPGLSEALEWGRLDWKRKAFTSLLPDKDLSQHYVWKDFSSRTLFEARVLGEIDTHHRANAERGRRPPWERVKSAHHGAGHHAVLARFSMTHFCCMPDLTFGCEVNELEHRALLRVALALAWHQAERGKAASSLQDLVPRYLPALPVSPLDGKGFEYADGTLVSRTEKGKAHWPVKRR